MIKTLQTKLRLGSLKSDCQFHSYQRGGGSALHSGKREGIYEPGVGFDWAMIIPSKMIIVRHSSDPLHDRISHFLLSRFSLWISGCVPALKLQQNTCMPQHQEGMRAPHRCCTAEVRRPSNRPMRRQVCMYYLRHNDITLPENWAKTAKINTNRRHQ